MKQAIKTVEKGVAAVVAGSATGAATFMVANEVLDSLTPKPIVFYAHRPLCPKATNSPISSNTPTFSQQKPSASKS